MLGHRYRKSIAEEGGRNTGRTWTEDGQRRQAELLARLHRLSTCPSGRSAGVSYRPGHLWALLGAQKRGWLQVSVRAWLLHGKAPCRVLCKAEALLRGPAEFPFFLERRKLCLSPSTSLSHRPERFNLAVIVPHRAGAGGVSSACTPTRCQRRAGLAQTSHARRTGRVPKAPRGGMYAHAPGLSQWALHPRSGNPYRAH
jgi:hypothetical protein